jgi:hypothetical protein
MVPDREGDGVDAHGRILSRRFDFREPKRQRAPWRDHYARR